MPGTLIKNATVLSLRSLTWLERFSEYVESENASSTWRDLWLIIPVEMQKQTTIAFNCYA